jgi:1,4-dihydroxy-2-naphthoate octaprenyltransferase
MTPIAVASPRRPRSGRLGIWLQGIRPRTLVAGAAPVVVGSAGAWHMACFDPGVAVAALAGALAVQAGANLVNDAADFSRGADGPGRIGPPRITQAGLATSREVYLAAAVAFAIAAACGVYLVQTGGVPILAIGLAAIATAVAYTAGPCPLAYLGLGEAAAFAFFGPIAVWGTTYLHAGDVPLRIMTLSGSLGLLAAALMGINNLRDREGDAAAGKRTLAVRFGPRAGAAIVRGALLLTYLNVVVTAVIGAHPWLAILPLLTAGRAMAIARATAPQAPSETLGPLLRDQTRLIAWFAVWLAAGLVLS